MFERDPDATLPPISTSVISPSNANLLKENLALAARLAAQDSDDDSGKTTKSTAQKLTEVLARLAVFEHSSTAPTQSKTTGQQRPKAHQTTLISPVPQSRAPVPDELSAAAADSGGQDT